MGTAYPELVKQHRVDHRRRPSRGGAVPHDARPGASSSSTAWCATATSTGDDAFFLHDTLGLPDRSHPRDRRRAGPGGRPRRLPARMAEQRTRAKEAHKAAGREGRRARRRSTASCSTRSGPTDFTGRQEYETDGAKVRAIVAASDRRAQAGSAAPRSRSCSTARRSTPRAGARSATPACSRSPTAVACAITDTRYALPGLVVHRGVVEAGAIAEGDTVRGPDRRRTSRRHPSQPHRDPRAALGAARGAGRPRAAGRLLRRSRPAALRLLPLRGRAAGRPGPGRGAGQRRGDHRRAGAPLRDDEGARARLGCDRVLRRQVRRPRAGARGRRALDRALRRHPRARARLHRAGQDRERGLDRREPAPDRGGHRCGSARAHPRRGGDPRRGRVRASRSTPEEVPQRIERLLGRAQGGPAGDRRRAGEDGGRRGRRRSPPTPSTAWSRSGATCPTTTCAASRSRPATRWARGSSPSSARCHPRGEKTALVGRGDRRSRRRGACSAAEIAAAGGRGARWRDGQEPGRGPGRGQEPGRSRRRAGRGRGRRPGRRSTASTADVARVLGVDLGERRIGLACSDPSGVLASPLRAITAQRRPGRRPRDRRGGRRGAGGATSSWSACPGRSPGAKVPPHAALGRRPRRWRNGPRPQGGSRWSCTTSGSPRARPSRRCARPGGAAA